MARRHQRWLRMRIVAHGTGGDGLWRLGLPSRNVWWVVHFLSAGIHGVVRVDFRQCASIVTKNQFSSFQS